MESGSTDKPAANGAPAGVAGQAAGSSNNPLMSGAPATPPAQAGQAAQVAAAGSADQMEGDDPSWIEKARQIIIRSKGDPFTRHDALNKLKMQYLKQRFGKELGDS